MSKEFLSKKQNQYNQNTNNNQNKQQNTPSVEEQLKGLETNMPYIDMSIFNLDAPEQAGQKQSFGHGVTNTQTILTYTKKNNKDLRKPKTIQLPAEKDVSVIKQTGEETNVSVEQNGTIYQGTISNNSVNITPNTVSELDPETKKSMVRSTASGSGWGAKAKEECHIHYGNIPEGLQENINWVLNGQISRGQALEQVNKTVTLPVDYGDLSNFEISDSLKEKYQNKTYIYRFTRFNNGNQKDVILIEELASDYKKEEISTKDIDKAKMIFYNYNISFKEPGAESAQADKELKQMLGNPDKTEEIAETHKKAYLPLKVKEKEEIYRSISKLPETVLNDIKGLKIGKKYCRLNEDKYNIDTDAPAFYSSSNHEIILVEAVKSLSSTVFGDKGSNDFANIREKQIIHEVGHAADFKKYNEIQHPISKTAKEKYDAYYKAFEFLTDEGYTSNISEIEEKRLTKEINALALDYNNFRSSFNGIEAETNSGYTKVNQHPGKDISYYKETDFTKALKLDSPNITDYSNKNAKEAYAEAFSLFILEPETLKALSPNVYNYFNQKY